MIYIITKVAIKSPANKAYAPAFKCPIITFGTPDNTQAVIIILIPFPIPYSVITSQSHKRKTVHAVTISILIRTREVSEVSIIVPPASEFNKIIIP
jgi:hypothetical protein